ncbi:MAG TPA: bifunctional shikimate kinase/3-dehydroquinate synthase [Candidatus Kapabacteria bacterium]|nr:bifunctional shikimate kinase/3-dehydroquinate synthase [Candidatus Kapabacteria bacterium]
MTWRGRHIYLTGLPGSGKTSIGKELAVRLTKSGYVFFDLDTEIERRNGHSIAEIFSRENGESIFRKLETDILVEIADEGFHQKPYVVATGGGTPLSVVNRQVMRGSGVVVWLDVTVRQSAKNVLASMLKGSIRPLLTASSPEELTEKLRLLYTERLPFYEQATLHFVARSKSEQSYSALELAAELHNALDQMSRRVRLRPKFETLIAHSAFGDYPISVGSGIAAAELARTASDMNVTRLILVSDNNVASIHSKRLHQSLIKESSGKLTLHQITIDSGEVNKNIKQALDLAGEFDKLNVSRKNDLLVSFGGGVVSDMTGFIANLYKRGIPIVHIPTTLVAQIDAAIGGKTGVDFNGKKNLLGTFFSPKRVIVDPIYLQTLPKRELQSGLSELLKYGLIGNTDLWNRLSRSIRRLLRGLDSGYEILIRDAVKEKLRYTNLDEFEQKNGVRELLNFGHTFAHAFESATGFSALLHGEAVALGMRAASWLSMKEGMISEDDWREIEITLGRLPIPSAQLKVSDVFEAMQSDKKNYRSGIRLILLERIGKAVVRESVERSKIKEAIEFAISVV